MATKPTRSEQRDAARARAKELREQQKKTDRRKRLVLQSSLALVIVAAVAGLVAVLVSGSNKEEVVPTNLMFNDGVKIGAGLEVYTPTNTPETKPSEEFGSVPNILLYVDYQCPVCQAFEVPNQSQIRSWVETGAATLELHPISFLDGRGSPNEYSSRAANAAICVAEYSPGKLFDFNAALFENQPEEGTPGPSNDELFATAQGVGVTNQDELKSCIKEKRFGSWIAKATDRALTEKVAGTDIQVEGTPAIVVNGQQYTWTTGEELVSPARFFQWLQQAAKL